MFKGTFQVPGGSASSPSRLHTEYTTGHIHSYKRGLQLSHTFQHIFYPPYSVMPTRGAPPLATPTSSPVFNVVSLPSTENLIELRSSDLSYSKETDQWQTELLTKLLQQLAACNAMADSLLDLLMSRNMGNSLLTSSPSLSSSLLSTLTNTSMSKDHGVSSVPSRSVSNTISQKPRVNPKGPIDKFVPGGFSLNGHWQHMYNGFIFDIPPSNTQGSVILVIHGWCVGIYPSWYGLCCHWIAA